MSPEKKRNEYLCKTNKSLHFIQNLKLQFYKNINLLLFSNLKYLKLL